MSRIRNALPELMGRHRIKQAALADAAGLRYATVNALYNGKTERVDFDTLAAVLDGLKALTGQRYTVGDLLEYSEAAPEAQEIDTAHLLSDGAGELHAQLQELEASTPPAELDAWEAAFTGKPA
ncbi:helix-turn-helix transcriptional regulator [Deinococcus aluminii]|uniref:HTH cro/C1-type domain-containing protein n=1 Tax=Deinococcus aluminii TaxID=1656885 RepID=A0ABP9XDF6_9DEIO